MDLQKRISKKTKIVSTLGPATSSKEMIEKLFLSGVNVFRVNFSHGEHETHGQVIKNIREIEEKHKRPIAVLADLQGPKFRVGKFENGEVELEIGQKFTFDSDETLGTSSRVYLPHDNVIKALKVGEKILLDDGRVQMVVEEKQADKIIAKVLAGKSLKDRKGFNLPNTNLPVSALTDKDRVDLDFALSQDVDFVALSFVQRPDDVAEAKKLINAHGSKNKVGLISKIEKPSAVDLIVPIIEASDGIMLARGDLGVEMPPEEVPSIQKKIVRICREQGKPIIVATQMLESMTDSPAPTRAEASDVATAVYEGSDAVMLSAETATGAYPLQAVEMMAKISNSIEDDEGYQRMRDAEAMLNDHTSSDAITFAAKQVSETIGASLIVTYTTSGSTAYRTSRMRPRTPILALTSDLKTSRKLCLSFGVYPFWAKDVKSFSKIIEKAIDIALREELVVEGQRIVVTAGVPFGAPGSTNTLRIAWVKKDN